MIRYILELTWKTLRDLLCSQVNATLLGPFNTYLLAMIEARKALTVIIKVGRLASDIYKQEATDAIGCKLCKAISLVFWRCASRFSAPAAGGWVILKPRLGHFRAPPNALAPEAGRPSSGASVWLILSCAIGCNHNSPDIDLCWKSYGTAT